MFRSLPIREKANCTVSRLKKNIIWITVLSVCRNLKKESKSNCCLANIAFTRSALDLGFKITGSVQIAGSNFLFSSDQVMIFLDIYRRIWIFVRLCTYDEY